MRIRRDMRVPPRAGPGAGPQCYARAGSRCEGFARAGRPPNRRLQAELGPHDPRDLAAVGAALRLAHHEADDHADRLHVALAQLLDDVGVRVERLLDDRLQRVAAADRAEALALDDPLGVAALGDEAVEDLLG